MTHKKAETVKLSITIVSVAVALVLGAMQVTGLPGCGEYITKANAAEIHKKLDEKDNELKKEQTEIIKLLHNIIGKLEK